MAAHRYWRISITANGAANGYASGSEIAMATSMGGANLCIGATLTASTVYTGTTASMLNDSNSTTWWASNNAIPAWVAVDFGAGNAYDIVEFRWTARNDTYYTQSPISGSLQYSDDGSAWTDRCTYSLPTMTSAGQTIAFRAPLSATISTVKLETLAQGNPKPVISTVKLETLVSLTLTYTPPIAKRRTCVVVM